MTMKAIDFLNDENVKMLLEPMGYWGKNYNYYVYASTYNPMIIALRRFGALGGLIMALLVKNAIVCLSDRGVAVVQVNLGNNITDKIELIPRDKLSELRYKMDIQATKIIVRRKEGKKTTFHVLNKMKKSPKHVENLSKIREVLDNDTIG